MSNEIHRPDGVKFYVARNANGSIIHIGETLPEQVTTTGQPVLEVADTESEQLGGLAEFAESFPPMPPVAEWLEAKKVYRHGEELFLVRQSHFRTTHEPGTVPALFIRHNPNGTDWIANEQVNVGTIRNYGGVVFIAIQAHVTQEDWQPPNVPSLWNEFITAPGGPDDWAIGVSYAVNDEVTYNGLAYRCLQSHTSQAGWTPPAVPALWQAI